MSGSPAYADADFMLTWANGVMASRAPDFIIGDNYLRRWWIVPRNQGCNVYLHEILHSDDDRALHDHPWDNTSCLIDGSYIEVTPEGEFLREAGSIVGRKATDAHRLVIPEGGRAVSLFITGPIIRQWGFHCPQGWRHWRDFVDDRDTGKIGRGCGEMPPPTPIGTTPLPDDVCVSGWEIGDGRHGGEADRRERAHDHG